ncbi:thermosome subunit beta [Halorubrum ezzemoulense]|uniref:thermosome subunit beta n=1 Tax=Halorubrum ezzemoulense TaxID=337243 RepID=UPI00232B5177|nr:thermosome subunit beta [Halorubrum ezzemoulense]MDB9250162.1 thermosome subunit beta [Halorubrum ezzemoulense]MDB9260330.1 thermosome subunit beta [Halorubrum ezzemoulense]MDB9263626.1 thermosome subunit beta [Halorubrum ezzemoulense]MDB9267114.1 thermosome subunit beta [Halorubrum ezzemoulense]MDB9270691.1 thermosome subunit beta [Halorubrum ezzemoulense]
MQQGQPMIIMGDDAQRVQDKDAQEYNISAARGVAESVRSTLGPKGMDKMLVNSMGDVTITNDGVTILQEMDIDNPTAEMVVEVAETQEDEAGDGTTSAVAIAGELLKNAEDLLEQDIHPTAVIKGFNLASEYAREQVDEVATAVDPDDTETLQNVAETSMTGKGAELDKDVLADLVVRAVQGVTVEADDGSHVVDLANLNIETRTGRAAGESRLLTGAAIDKDPVHDDMPTDFESANVLLLNDPIEVEEADVDTSVNVDSPDQLQKFLDQEEEQLREKVDQIVDSGADVVFCQKGIDDLAQHYLAKEGVLAVRRTKKSDLTFLKNVLGAPIVTDLDSLTADDLAVGSVERDGDEELFYVEGEDAHGVTLLLYGTTDHVVDELERGIQDALDVVSTTVSDGRTLPGGGAVEVEIARRLRDYADSVEGREQLAVEAFADSLELIPRVLAENAGLDAIDLLVDLRAAHEAGDQHAGLDVFAGEVVDTAEAGVVETAHAKEQAIASAAEAANLVLKIDDIISAGDLSTAGGDDEGGVPGSGMGGMGGMGGAM